MPPVPLGFRPHGAQSNHIAFVYAVLFPPSGSYPGAVGSLASKVPSHVLCDVKQEGRNPPALLKPWFLPYGLSQLGVWALTAGSVVPDGALCVAIATTMSHICCVFLIYPVFFQSAPSPTS